MLINCTTCTYKKVTIIKGFQSSNYIQQYKNKHSEIAYNKTIKKTKIKKQNLSLKTNFFNISFIIIDNQKRIENDIIIDFNKNDAYNKILNFIIENNLSFNIFELTTFKDLLNYYN